MSTFNDIRTRFEVAMAMNEAKLEEYENKWLERVNRYHDNKKSLGNAKPSDI